jgi:hypothetical protein
VHTTEVVIDETAYSILVFALVVALACGLACCLPVMTDFFCARCRLARNRRYQLSTLVAAATLALGLAAALAAADVDFIHIVGASTLLAFALAIALQDSGRQWSAGFWVQSDTLVEPGKLIAVEGRVYEVLELGAFRTRVRLLGLESPTTGELTTAALAGGSWYAERIEHIPNAVLFDRTIVEYKHPSVHLSRYAPAASSSSGIVESVRAAAPATYAPTAATTTVAGMRRRQQQLPSNLPAHLTHDTVMSLVETLSRGDVNRI